MTNKGSNKLFTKNLALVTIINFLLYTSYQMFPSALPPYVSSLGGDTRILGWITGIATIATLFVRPLSGFLLDRYGRKGIFIFGVVIMALATASYGFFPIISVILIFRFFHGIGWGAATTASITLATDNIDKARFGEGMGYFSLSASIALAIAPMASLYFEINKVIIFGALILIIPFVLIFFMDIEDLPVLLESNKKQSLYEKKSILPSILIMFTTTTYGAIITFLPAMGKDRGVLNIGLFFTIYALCMIITRPILGKIIDTTGYNTLIVIGLVLLTISLFLISRINSTAGIFLSAIIYGIGYGSLQTCLQTMAMDGVSHDRTGTANATFYTGFDAGIGLGSIISGFLVAKFSYSGMFLSLLAFPIIGLVIFFIFKSNKKETIS